MDISIYHGLAEPTIQFCEANNVGSWIEQPANSFSSLFISLAGVYMLVNKRWHDFSLWLGWVAILTGLASFAYHATFTFIGQLADLGSMFLLGSFLIVAALRLLNDIKALLIMVAGTVVPLIITATFRTIGGFNIGIPLFAIILASAIVLELNNARKEGIKTFYYGLAFVIFIIGWGIWWLDLKRIWCDPTTFHLINGHSLWHIANAMALLALDRYFAARATTIKRVQG